VKIFIIALLFYYAVIAQFNSSLNVNFKTEESKIIKGLSYGYCKVEVESELNLEFELSEYKNSSKKIIIEKNSNSYSLYINLLNLIYKSSYRLLIKSSKNQTGEIYLALESYFFYVIDVSENEDLNSDNSTLEKNSSTQNYENTNFLNQELIADSDIFDYSEVYIKPTFINKLIIEYPSLARKAGVVGSVTVTFIINKIGKAVNLLVTNGHPMLDDAAIKAFEQCRFTPGESYGEKVNVRWFKTIHYNLVNDPEAKNK
jgi:TonB family protein